MPNIHEIISALQARRSGSGWKARCPAHEDRTPSLAIREHNGRILVHCHAGCAQQDVIAALRERGLWPERSRRPHPPGEPADPDRAHDQVRAAYWKITSMVLAEWLLEDISLSDPDRRPLSELLRVLYLSDEALVNEYRAWKEREPELTAGLVHAGRLIDAQLQGRLARWIERGMNGEFTQDPDHG